MLPSKLKDPSTFNILCTTGNLNIVITFFNLEATINLMTVSMIKKIDYT